MLTFVKLRESCVKYLNYKWLKTILFSILCSTQLIVSVSIFHATVYICWTSCDKSMGKIKTKGMAKKYLWRDKMNEKQKTISWYNDVTDSKVELISYQ